MSKVAVPRPVSEKYKKKTSVRTVKTVSHGSCRVKRKPNSKYVMNGQAT